jgi:hypothetical protein
MVAEFDSLRCSRESNSMDFASELCELIMWIDTLVFV